MSSRIALFATGATVALSFAISHALGMVDSSPMPAAGVGATALFIAVPTLLIMSLLTKLVGKVLQSARPRLLLTTLALTASATTFTVLFAFMVLGALLEDIISQFVWTAMSSPLRSYGRVSLCLAGALVSPALVLLLGVKNLQAQPGDA